MKYRLKVEHVPTGKVWEGDREELPPEGLTSAQQLCEQIAKGVTSYLKFASGDEEIFLTENTLKNCTVYLVKG